MLSSFSRVFVLAVIEMVVKLDIVVRSGEPYLRASYVISRTVHVVRYPRGSCR